MEPAAAPSAPVLVVGGGIGGMAAAFALHQQGFAVEVFEQQNEIGEIGAGPQLGPNGFAALGFTIRFAAEQYNIVVTFHSRQQEEWGVREEVMSYFTEIIAKPRQLLDMPTSWKRWSTADCEPVGRLRTGRATLLGDAAHPMLQYVAQGACIALEDAVTLPDAIRAYGRDLEAAFRLYEAKRLVRTARLVISAREMGRIYHAKGVARLVPNSLWVGRAPERYYDALEWLYGWTVDKCLA